MQGNLACEFTIDPGERKVVTISNTELSERLWETVIGSVGTLKIDASCQLLLKAWITNGAERMKNEGRLMPKDIATANENLKSFIELMKAEVLSRGTGRLDNRCFLAAQHKLERHSFLTVFSLWPFWPHAVTV